MVQFLTNDIEQLKQGIRDFIENEVEPHANLIEESDEIPQSILDKSKEMGLFALSIPEEYGGLGIGMVGKCAVLEEVGRTINGYTTVIGGHTGIGSVGIVELEMKNKRKNIYQNGNREYIGAFALTEPSAGSHAHNLKTTAVKKGDHYILNGSKCYITNAGLPDVFTVMAVTDPSKGPKGITSFIVEKNFPGFQLGNNRKENGSSWIAHMGSFL